MTVLEVDVVKAVPAPVAPAFIRRVLTRAAAVPEVAARLPEGASAVAVRITDDTEMARLNATYAGENHATDVLSFEGHGDHVGDIAISWQAVERQARQFRLDTKAELALLVVHGLLHLLGWDHARAAERKEMNRLTEAGLERSGIKLGADRI